MFMRCGLGYWHRGLDLLRKTNCDGIIKIIKDESLRVMREA
jgi:hypothetical protein